METRLSVILGIIDSLEQQVKELKKLVLLEIDNTHQPLHSLSSETGSTEQKEFKETVLSSDRQETAPPQQDLPEDDRKPAARRDLPTEEPIIAVDSDEDIEPILYKSIAPVKKPKHPSGLNRYVPDKPPITSVNRTPYTSSEKKAFTTPYALDHRYRNVEPPWNNLRILKGPITEREREFRIEFNKIRKRIVDKWDDETVPAYKKKVQEREREVAWERENVRRANEQAQQRKKARRVKPDVV